ncbi:MAG: DEAD/DEAH box helicase [Bacteroidales bacterium]|jgi:ATP-dependent RNA helicase RhlE|nr:DEAD/DEAH box helicase [Bacteroidales bacterium]
MTFSELKISEPVLRALDDLQYSIPTVIQQKAIPVAMAGRDVLGLAQTGTGKTAAFAIPIIERFKSGSAQYDDAGARDNYAGTRNNAGARANSKRTSPFRKKEKREIQALIVTPTRELAIQIDDSFTDYGKYTSVRHAVIFGGVKQNPQVRQLERGVDVLIATPGRLLDLIGQGFIKLDNVKVFVLDEADRMLDMGFIHDIRKLLPMLPAKKQTMMFSATMPKEIDTISKSLLDRPVRVEAAPVASVVDTIDQYLYYVEKPDKLELLISLINKKRNDRVLVFSRTKHGADKIAKTLNRRHINCEAIHGNKSQNARQTALNNFKSGKTKIIIATDIAARGIDVQDLGVVINYDLPDVAETYVHRIGRTGRAGNTGVAFTFCTKEEKSMLNDIQKLTKKHLKLNTVQG